MVGLLTNNKIIKNHEQIKKLNNKLLKNFANLFYNSSRSNEKQAKDYWKKVEKIGFPSFNHEEWHYSSLIKILNTKYKLSNNKFNKLINEKIKKLIISFCGWKIILFNGFYISTLSNDNLNPYTIKQINTNTIIPSPIINNEIFLYLTESLAAQPLLINLDDNQQTKKPLYILNITSGSSNNNYTNTSHYRYHLEIGSNCKSQIIEYFISIDNKPNLIGSRLTANIGDNSYFNHIKINIDNNQSYYFSHNDILSGKNTKINSNCIFINSELLRHNTSIKLNDTNSNLTLNSFLLSKNTNIIDNRTYLEHNKPFCKSNQLHKMIAIDKSKATFNGIIKVTPQAIKTDSIMINNNLLLGQQAEINTKPQLEIYADDVKCSHGATIGKIDNNQIFYLRSRGIHFNDAKHMIIIAFATEIIKTINNKTINKKIIKIIKQCLIGI